MGIGMKIDYKNRHKDVITFELLPDGTFTMKGGSYYNFGVYQKLYTINDNVLYYVDPSGGPFVSKGMSMGFFTPRWLGYIVRYCRINGDHIVIFPYPDRIVKNKTNGEIFWKIYNPDGVNIEVYKSYEDAVKYIEEKYDNNEFGQISKIRD